MRPQKALFEDEGSADINYSGHDVDELIKRVEETEEVEEEDGAKSMSFGFAKIWEASKAAEEDTEDNPDAAAAQPEDSGFWDKIVQRAAIEKQKEIEAMGRGAKRNRNKVSPRFVLLEVGSCSTDGHLPVRFPDCIRRGTPVAEQGPPHVWPRHVRLWRLGGRLLGGARLGLCARVSRVQPGASAA